MPWDYTYEDPDQVEIKEMKECENKNCAVEVVSNSDQPENSDMEENGNCHPMLQHETSTDNGEIAGQRDDNLGEYPVLRRGRKSNRPKPAKQKIKPDIELTLDAIREKQQADPILRQVLRLKNEGIKPPWEEISYESVNLKFWLARWESLEIKNGIVCMFWDIFDFVYFILVFVLCFCFIFVIKKKNKTFLFKGIYLVSINPLI
jgi:hypothetical protein